MNCRNIINVWCSLFHISSILDTIFILLLLIDVTWFIIVVGLIRPIIDIPFAATVITKSICINITFVMITSSYVYLFTLSSYIFGSYLLLYDL